MARSASDEAISCTGRDCFATLAMTRDAGFPDMP